MINKKKLNISFFLALTLLNTVANAQYWLYVSNELISVNTETDRRTSAGATATDLTATAGGAEAEITPLSPDVYYRAQTSSKANHHLTTLAETLSEDEFQSILKVLLKGLNATSPANSIMSLLILDHCMGMQPNENAKWSLFCLQIFLLNDLVLRAGLEALPIELLLKLQTRSYRYNENYRMERTLNSIMLAQTFGRSLATPTDRTLSDLQTLEPSAMDSLLEFVSTYAFDPITTTSTMQRAREAFTANVAKLMQDEANAREEIISLSEIYPASPPKLFEARQNLRLVRSRATSGPSLFILLATDPIFSSLQ